jgi:ribokinase
MMAKPKIVDLGSCNMDIYSWTDHLAEPGETILGERYWMGMGGKGANQAVAASRLGAEVTMIGRVGDDLFGKQMLETLGSYGVECEHITMEAGVNSGVALVTVDKKPENVIVVVPGTNMRISPADVDAAASKIKSASILMMQLEIPLDAIERAVDIACEGDTICILNPAPARPLPERLIKKVHIMTPNQNEVKVLTGVPADTIDGAREAGKALLKMGAKQVVVTLGARGALIVTHSGSIHVEGNVVADCLDTTGAGDAFMGGLAVGLAQGKTLEEAVRFANIIGALSTRKPGAMPAMPTLQEVEAFSQALKADPGKKINC